MRVGCIAPAMRPTAATSSPIATTSPPPSQPTTNGSGRGYSPERVYATQAAHSTQVLRGESLRGARMTRLFVCFFFFFFFFFFFGGGG